MISIIGIGPGGAQYLTQEARDKVEAADMVAGSERLLELFPDLKAERLVLDGNIKAVTEIICNSAARRVAVLVSGDPGLFSLMGTIKNKISPEVLDVVPGISSVQLLFARLGIAWDDVKLISLHGRPDEKTILLKAAAGNSKIAIFTGSNFPPGTIASTLIESGFSGMAAVGENLSYPGERLLVTTLEELAEMVGLGTSVLYLELEKHTSRAGDGSGKLYGIGIGPGDPELITLKAAKIIAGSTLIFVPRSSEKSESLAFAIAGHLTDKNAKVKELTFPMTKDKQVLESYWRKAADDILKEIENGNDVAFLTLGDPGLYSTFAYAAKRVRLSNAKVEVEVIPGVSSPFACAAAANIALAEGEEKVAIIPTPKKVSDLSAVIDNFDTIVLLKVGAKLGELVKFLEEKGLLDKTVLVKSVGLPDEAIFKDLLNTKADDRIGYFSTVIVKK